MRPPRLGMSKVLWQRESAKPACQQTITVTVDFKTHPHEVPVAVFPRTMYHGRYTGVQGIFKLQSIDLCHQYAGNFISDG